MSEAVKRQIEVLPGALWEEEVENKRFSGRKGKEARKEKRS